MPQVKPSQQYFGIDLALLYHVGVRTFAQKRPAVFRGKDEYLILIKAAANPLFFSRLTVENNLLQPFASIYARQPGDVLAFMSVVRKIISKWHKTQAGKVIEFSYTNMTVAVEVRKRVCDDNRKLIAVIVKNKLTDVERTISVKNLSPEESENCLFPRLRAVHSLGDKELATLLNVKTDSVKKARQSIVCMNREMAMWEPSEVVQYMKTGVITPELKLLWKTRRKGKK